MGVVMWPSILPLCCFLDLLALLRFAVTLLILGLLCYDAASDILSQRDLESIILTVSSLFSTLKINGFS